MQQSNPLYDITAVRITFTNKCTAQCITCLNKTIQEFYELKPETFKKFINDLLALNLPKLKAVSFFSIGESYLHPNFIELCEWAIPKLKEKNIITSLVTNGSLSTQIPKGIDNYYISFNAGKKESYEKITKLNFDTVYQNIWNLYTSGEYKKAKNFEIHMLCFDLNKGEETDLKKLFYGMKNVRLRFSYKYDNNFKQTDGTSIIDKQGRIPCNYLTETINLHPNGDLILCAHDFKGTTVFGNVEKEKLEDILLSKKRLKLLEEHNSGVFPGLCEQCDYNSTGFDDDPFVFRWADPEQDIEELNSQIKLLKKQRPDRKKVILSRLIKSLKKLFR